MPREIVHCQVGQCGNQIGTAFWNTMRAEHLLAEDGKFTGDVDKDWVRLEKVDVYYKESGQHRYVPRAVLIDLEPGTAEVIKASPIGKMFKPDNFAWGASGAGNNWAKGHYTEGAELIDEVVDIVRKEIEGCDCPQGIQLTQSLGGGTGSGMGTLLLMKCRDNYPDRILATYSVYPSPKVSDVVVEPYNATLSIHQLLENSDETFVIDNEALYNISHNVLKQNTPKYSDLNLVISQVMAGVTASLRFPGKLNGDLRKLGVNLVPFPRLHFFLIAHSPLLSPEEMGHVKLTVQEVTSQMWSSRNFLANVKAEEGKYLSASLGYRGAQLSSQEIDDQVQQVQQKLEEDFVKWIPNNIKSSIINVPPNDSPISGTFVANTTSMKAVFQRIATQFAKMYKRKAFLHWYKGEGMDEMEFQEADKNVRDLVTEYQDKQDAVVDAAGGDQNEEHNEDEQQDQDQGDADAGGDEPQEDQPQEDQEF
jgi:tubulin beta